MIQSTPETLNSSPGSDQVTRRIDAHSFSRNMAGMTPEAIEALAPRRDLQLETYVFDGRTN